MSELGKSAYTPAGFRQGAVAILDALGFRGVWRRRDLGVLRESLRNLSDLVVDDVAALVSRIGVTKPAIDLRFLSDTVVFTVAHDLPFSGDLSVDDSGAIGRMPAVGPFSVEVAAAFCSLLQARALLAEVPLAYRGAIGFGEFLVDDNFLIGPAIDEVAAGHQVANAAVVFLLPSAAAELGPSLCGQGDPWLLRRVLLPRYPLPVRYFRRRAVPVVNPIALHGLPDGSMERLLESFGKPRLLSSVWWKRRATRRLLVAAERHLRKSEGA